MMNQGCALALVGASGRAVELLSAGIAATRRQNWLPFNLLHLARAHAELGQFEEAWRCIDEALARVEKTKEKWCEAEVHRTVGDIELMSPARDPAKAEAHFERALTVARSQRAKSWELRAATSLARLLAGPGQEGPGARSSRSGLWLVHRRLQYARPEGGQSPARCACVISATAT